jgi:hypothetical protein
VVKKDNFLLACLRAYVHSMNMQSLFFILVFASMNLVGCSASNVEVRKDAIRKINKPAKMKCVSRYYEPGATRTTCLKHLVKS